MKDYVEFMQGPELEEIESFYAKKNSPTVLGGGSFKDWKKEQCHDLRSEKGMPASKELALSSTTIRSLVAKSFSVEDVAPRRSKRGIENPPRDVAIYLQRIYCPQTLAELEQDYGVSSHSNIVS